MADDDRDEAERRFLDRARGCLLGLAVGDALGTAVEFCAPGSFAPLSDMVGGGPFSLEPGQWTDDTAMALCLADSLIECRGFDPVDQLQRYVRWWDEGYMSCTGSCVDIGNTVSRALTRFKRTGEPYPGIADDWSAGNGSIMRLAPVALFYAANPRKAIDFAAASSRTTHRAVEPVDACRYMTSVIVGLLAGRPRDEVLSPRYEAVPGLWDREPLVRLVAKVRQGSFRQRQPPQVRGSGHVIASLEAALWAFARSDSFEEGALLAVNLGDDADTTGAVYGQIAGAAHGMSGIPRRWLGRLAWCERIRAMADLLVIRKGMKNEG
jgi:ADP-ribosyl-[dinitrogen reductase] hydrolase